MRDWQGTVPAETVCNPNLLEPCWVNATFPLHVLLQSASVGARSTLASSFPVTALFRLPSSACQID
jgi:hypothetical protein